MRFNSNLFCILTAGILLLVTPLCRGQVSAPHSSHIVSDENDINIAGQKIDNLYITFSRHLVIVAGNDADTAKLCRYTLPELPDPGMIFQCPAERHTGFYFEKVKINDFSATVRMAGGRRRQAGIGISTEEKQMASYWDNRYKKYYVTHYTVGGTVPGDTIEINWSYSVPFRENYMRFISFRVFLHGDLFKEQYSLQMHFDNKLNVRFRYENQGEPDTVFREGLLRTMVWQKRSLPGCMDEPGSRPYVTLPHFIFTMLPDGMLYTIPYTFQYTLPPLYSYPAYYREDATIKIIRAVALGTKNPQYNKIRDWVGARKAEVKRDSTGYLQLARLNDCIADDFTYDKDIPYYRFIDEFDESMGDNLDRKNLRSISRYNLYPALIFSLKLNYFTAYVADKRSGMLSDDYVQPMFESDYLFAVPLNDGSLHYLYPKRSRTGYYINELPFYFENAKAQLVLIDDFSNNKKAINDKTRYNYLPASLVGDNYRKSNVMVEVSLDSLATRFSARVTLAGQFSTMTRGLYLYNDIDPTVNPAYGIPVWNIRNNATVISKDVTVAEKTFPFKTSVSATYNVPGLITRADSTYRIDLSGWFNFITEPGFSSSGRVQPYFADFTGTDSYTYLVRLNRPVSLGAHPQTRYVRNTFGDAVIEVTQTNPTEILITAKQVIKTDMVQAEKAGEVESVHKALGSLDAAFITLIPK